MRIPYFCAHKRFIIASPHILTSLFLASLLGGLGDLARTASVLLNRLDNSDGNSLTHLDIMLAIENLQAKRGTKEEGRKKSGTRRENM